MKVMLEIWLIAIAWFTAKQALIYLVVTSGIKVLPPPGTPFNLYTFWFDWMHQLFNINNTRLTTAPVITPPAAPAQGLHDTH
jgi:hypothetical protein